MDDRLKIALWNVFIDKFGRVFDRNLGWTHLSGSKARAEQIWSGPMECRLDDIPHVARTFLQSVRTWFDKLPWHGVYDFVEYLVWWRLSDWRDGAEVVQSFNEALASNLAGYRIIDGRVAPIVSNLEQASVNDALLAAQQHRLDGVYQHFHTAIAALSNREAPDYRNCIKESVSAVESLCALIAQDGKAELGQALKVVEQRITLHPAPKSAWMKMYGWTSDDQGIRHALMDEPSLTQADARYMPVSCSAFVGLLMEKCATTGIELKAR